MKNVYSITKDDDGQKLHKWMRKKFPNSPLSLIHRLIRKKDVKINKKSAKGEEILQEGNHVEIFYNFQKSDQPLPQKKVMIPEKILKEKILPLYEDEDILVLNKPAGIPVHPGSKMAPGKSMIEMLEQKYSEITPRLVHRLDKDTSGALLVAKNGSILRKLLSELQSGKFYKEYRVLVFGKVFPEKATININLERNAFGKKISAGEGKSAVTHYETIENFEISYSEDGASTPPFQNITFLRVLLETGRTHQIRAHFLELGYPLVMDNQHGDFAKNRAFKKKFGLRRQFLHAFRLSFFHPELKEEISVEAPLFEDLEDIIQMIK